MATGDSDDVLDRVKKLLPRRWFSWTAPLRDALLGGISDGAAKCYDLYLYAKDQSRISTSTGPFLDLIAYDYLGALLPRGDMSDETYRQMILITILQPRVTRAAMSSIIKRITGHEPEIFEPWNTYDTGAYGVPTMGYGVGHGGWGNMDMPGQAFIKIYRGEGSGIPNVAGWGAPIGGWGVGAIQWIGERVGLTGITDAFLYRVVNQTRPTGSAVWVKFADGTHTVVTPPIVNIYNLVAQPHHFALSGSDSFARVSYKLKAFGASFSLTGFESSAATLRSYSLVGQTRNFALTGFASFARLAYKITAANGTFTLIGSNSSASTAHSFNLLGQVGSFALTGYNSYAVVNFDAPSMNFTSAINSQYVPLIMTSSEGGTSAPPALDFSKPGNSGYLALI